MFDLFRSRDKAVRFFLTALLSLVALSMVAYLIPGYGGSGATPNDNVVAEVGKHKVTVRDVQLAIRAATKNREMPPQLMAHYIPQMIEQMITEKAMIYEANRLGFQVSEADTAKAIRDQMPAMFPNGAFVGKEAYAAALAQQDMTIPEFEEYMANQILLNRLRSVVLESTVVSRADIEREFRRKNEKATIEYVKVDPAKIKAGIQLSPEEMRDYYEKNKATFTIPEKRGMKLVVLDPAKITEAVSVSDEQVRRAYEQNKDRYRTPERVKARHILLMTSGKSPQEEAKIKAQAEDVLKQLKSGGNFAELAKKYSEDPGSKDKGGDLDWVVRGQTVPEFEKALYALKPNEISSIVKTQYGFHIIQALEKQDAHLKSLDEVKAELITELKKQMGQNQIQTALDSAAAALKKNPDQVDQIAAQYHLSVTNVEKAGAGDPVPEVGVNRDFEEAVSSLKKGEVSQAVAAPGNRMVIAVITNVFPAHPATFEEAESQIRPALLQDKANRLVMEKGDELAAKVRAANGDLKKVAQSMGLQYVAAPEFTRNGAIEGLGSPDAIPEIFTKPAGTIFGPTMVGGFRVVGKVTARIEPNLAELPAQTDAIRDDIKHTKARERNALFEDGLRQQMMKDGKIKIHTEVMKRLTANYRG
ncbi:MAG TPA: peptidylprolyl isomerase [Bryobacteraceae bacterium]|jgi:peptidyl-prolyl cis-trans isomerase D|nr:peptidylprolyl isomerase [Bryobacteraceae bacterium]